MASASQPNGTTSANGTGGKQRSQVSRPPRPNYNKLHALPLPLDVYPLPPLIPHNPLSILQIAFTYIFQLVAPPSSHPKALYRGYYSSETRSVHVTDVVAIRALWEKGFFGKGSLSRSEPSWLDREKRRRGVAVGETGEEVTGRRREERREFKKERARKEREAIEEKLKEERRLREGRESGNGPTVLSSVLQVQPGSAEAIIVDGNVESDKENIAPNGNRIRLSTEVESEPGKPQQPEDNRTLKGVHFKDQEHFQLTLEESLFLTYALGILSITSPTASTPLTTSTLLTLSRQSSYFPPIPPNDLQPDDPFLLSYIGYHHFRSLGWVVRPGSKFAVDYLLYLRGPVFTHAQFAVVILPSYGHEHWRQEGRQEMVRKKERKSLWWVHCVNRVQTQVRKGLVVVWVEVPPPEKVECGGDSGEQDVDIGRLLKKYKVREMTLKRWSPNRGKG